MGTAGPDPDYILGRGEMQLAGITPAELPFFRDWCRSRLTPLYFRMDEPVARASLLIEHVEAYAAELALSDPARSGRLTLSIKAAKEAHTLHVSVLKRYRLKHLPTMPDPRTTGSVPTEVEDETPSQTAQDRRGARHGEDEAWDPSWGDPDQELPKARPQGMRALAPEDIAIPPRPKPKPSQAAKAQRQKLTGPKRPPSA
jgi:hypothetical protein